MRRWDGAMVDAACFEPRHPQDFVRGLKESHALPYTRPDVSNELSYSPTWGLIASLGNGSLEGTYNQITDSNGDSVITVIVRATIGSTTTFNAGNWTISVPVACGGVAATGHAEAATYGVTTFGTVSLAASATTASVKSNDNNRTWSDTVPKTWATGNTLYLTISYGTKV